MPLYVGSRIPLLSRPAASAGVLTFTATWDSANKGANVTLSGGNLTATGSGAGGGVLATHGRAVSAGGKYYWEITVGDTLNSGDHGFTPNGVDVSETGLIGLDLTILAAVSETSFNCVLYVGDASTHNLDAFADNDEIGFALDMTNELLYVHKNNTYYNLTGGGAGNPSAGTNGLNIASELTGTVYPYAGLNSGSSGTANFGGSAFIHTLPTGYVSWNGT
jgi:hypothetical protein